MRSQILYKIIMKLHKDFFLLRNTHSVQPHIFVQDFTEFNMNFRFYLLEDKSYK